MRARLWGPADADWLQTSPRGQQHTALSDPFIRPIPKTENKRWMRPDLQRPSFPASWHPNTSVMNKHLHPLTWIFRRHKCKSPRCDATFTLLCMSWAWATALIPADQKVSLNSWRHVRTRVFKGSDSKHTSRIILWRNLLLVCAWERIYETAKWQHDGRKHQRGATCFCMAQIVWEETQACAESALDHSKYT